MCFQPETESVLKLVKTRAVAKVKPVKRFKVETKDDIGRALDAFLNSDTQTAKFDRYQVDGDSLVYRAPVTDEVKFSADKLPDLKAMIKSGAVVLVSPDIAELNAKANAAKVKSLENRGDRTSWGPTDSIKVKIKFIKQDVIARRIRQNGEVLHVGNSSMLGLIGRTVSFGNERANRTETDVQSRLSRMVPMVPFSVFEQADLDLTSMKLIARGDAETITRKRQSGTDRKTGKPVWVDETVHYTGASLFDVGGSVFLFDLDRRELEHKIFNPFLVKLPGRVASIAEAYESLKPAEVKAAEAAGIKIKRQGEWFFIPVDASQAAKLDSLAEIQGALKPITLRAGRNRPNNAKGLQVHRGRAVPERSGFDSDRDTASEYFVQGKVAHSGREHADLILPGWYRAVPNTATDSFTITGDVD